MNLDKSLRDNLIKDFMPIPNEVQHSPESRNIDDILIKPESEDEFDEEEPIHITYKYLDDSILSKNFEYNPEIQYTIYLCLFSIKQDKLFPYVVYYSVKDDTYSFPQATLDNNLFLERQNESKEKEIKIKKDENEKEESMIDSFLKLFQKTTNEEEIVVDTNDATSIFNNQVFEFYEKATKIKPTENNYRGFLQDLGNIFVFFDCTNIILPEYYDLDLKDKKLFTSIIVKDIEEKHINNLTINDNIINMFSMYPFLNVLKEEDNTEVMNPIRAYICQEDGEQYKNSFYNNKDQEISLLYQKIYHDTFDYIYVFTDEPIDSYNIENIKSFILFVNKDIPVIIDSEIENETKQQDAEQYDVFYFSKQGQKYYGIRNTQYFEEF